MPERVDQQNRTPHGQFSSSAEQWLTIMASFSKLQLRDLSSCLAVCSIVDTNTPPGSMQYFHSSVYFELVVRQPTLIKRISIKRGKKTHIIKSLSYTHKRARVTVIGKTKILAQKIQIALESKCNRSRDELASNFKGSQLVLKIEQQWVVTPVW